MRRPSARPFFSLFFALLVGCGAGPDQICDEANNPCPSGLACIRGSCNAPACNDSVRDGTETDVDCGGSCPAKCLVNQHCNSGIDCASSECVNNLCACPAGQHANGTACTANTDACCGDACADCPSSFAHGHGACDGRTGSCVLTSCSAGAHLCTGQCVLNASPATCGNASCLACPAPSNGTATCDGTSCAISCLGTFHASGATCVANSDSCCGSGCTDCTAPTQYPNGTGACTPSSGTCALKGCKPGYTQVGEVCVVQGSSSCGQGGVDCTKLYPNGTGSCGGGTCSLAACNSTYHVNSGATACAANSDTCCGGSATTNCANCTNATSYPNGTFKCDTSAGSCAAQSCALNYHLNAAHTGCDYNSNINCGPSRIDCTAVPNGTGTCTPGPGTCAFTCNQYYHSNGAACVLNSDTCCADTGSGNCTNCTTQYLNGTGSCTTSNGTCTLSSCVGGFHICGTACASNASTNSCGASCTVCPATADAHGITSCDGTNCGTTCNSGYHLCGGVCVSNNSLSSCGASSCTACPATTDLNGTTSCDGTSCGTTCKTGYNRCGGSATCVKETANACGSSCTSCTDSCSNGSCVCLCTYGCCGGTCRPQNGQCP